MKRKFFNSSMYLRIFLMLNVININAVNIGSDAAFTRFSAQQAVNNGDRIAGFAAIEAGFRLTSSSVIGIFDSFIPVTGSIDFNGGTLRLARDLVLRDVTDVVRLGNIIGSNHSLELSSTSTLITSSNSGSTCFKFGNLNVALNDNVTFQNCCITFTGLCLLNGQGNCLTLAPTATFIIDHNASLLMKDITIKGVSGNQIQCLDNTATLTLSAVKWILDADYSFTTGHFDIFKDFHVVGEGFKFNYLTSQISSIYPDATMILDQSVTFSYNPPIANRDLLRFIDNTAQLRLLGATLHATTTGLRLTKGQLLVNNRSFLSSDATVEAQAMSFGDGTSTANNIDLQILPAANLVLLQGMLVDNNV